jgi:hypothetical protein
MIRRSILIAAALAAATRAPADTLSDMKSALRNLRAKQPVRALYEKKSTNVARGRFFDQDSTSAAAVEARVDDEGVTILYPRALLDRAAAQRNAKKNDPKVQTVARVEPALIAEMLDYAPELAALLDRSSVVEERASSYNARPARLLVLNVRQDPLEMKEGHMDVKLDRLSIWIGLDSLPLFAEHTMKFSAGILFLKVDGEQTEKQTFVRRDDRLILTRHDHIDSSSGMGQTSHNSETETIRIEN